jgi:hypothetical protein
VVKIGGEEPLGNRAFGWHQHWNSQKNWGKPVPRKDRNTTPQIHNKIELKRGEGIVRCKKSVFH